MSRLQHPTSRLPINITLQFPRPVNDVVLIFLQLSLPVVEHYIFFVACMVSNDLTGFVDKKMVADVKASDYR